MGILHFNDNTHVGDSATRTGKNRGDLWWEKVATSFGSSSVGEFSWLTDSHK